MRKKENKLQKNIKRTLMEAYSYGSTDCCNGTINSGNGNDNGNGNGNNNGTGNGNGGKGK